jgi:hypothetical protein
LGTLLALVTGLLLLTLVFLIIPTLTTGLQGIVTPVLERRIRLGLLDLLSGLFVIGLLLLREMSLATSGQSPFTVTNSAIDTYQ